MRLLFVMVKDENGSEECAVLGMEKSEQYLGYALEAELIRLDGLDVERWGMVRKINGYFSERITQHFSIFHPSLFHLHKHTHAFL